MKWSQSKIFSLKKIFSPKKERNIFRNKINFEVFLLRFVLGFFSYTTNGATYT